MPTPSNLATRLTQFSMTALKSGAAIAAKPHVVTALGHQLSLVSWQSSEAPDLSNVSIEDVRTYLFFLENEHYSIVCQDGAIIQMSFKVERGRIVHHRLCYLPCPVIFDEDELILDSLYDIVERNVHSQNYELLRYRGVVRFDYDPSAVTMDHPSCHLTINYDQVRVPVGRVMDASTFLRFVDTNFSAPRKNAKAFGVTMSPDGTPDVLAAEDRFKPHLFWSPP